ncbi:alcohol dehydrogenase catalytic domain-containing protein [Streptomyces marincola]|nr:alcohol dehydrogenase catalytic domain-containing protein [Streptomyces marincola]
MISTAVRVPAVTRSMVLRRFGDPETALELTERHPVPAPGRGEVLIAVRAVSVGRTLDLATRAGLPPFAPQVRLPHVLGADHVGEVVAHGDGVGGPALGTRVAVFPVVCCGRCDACAAGRTELCGGMELIGVHRPGAYAGYCRVPAANVRPVPEDMSDGAACALALNGPVAHRQLEVAGVEQGDWVLVNGAAGGLGTALCAVALHRGLRVLACARQPWQREALRTLGVQAALDPGADDFAAAVGSLTDGRGVAAVVDNLATQELAAALPAVLAPGGALVCSGALGAGTARLDLRALYLRSQRVLGVRTARLTDVDATWAAAAGGLRPVVDERRAFGVEDAAEAHRYLDEGRNFGRVVLAWS